MSFNIFPGWGTNAEQLFLMLFWVQCMSQELLSKDPGFHSVCGLLWFNASQTFCYVRLALMMRMFLDIHLFFMSRIVSVTHLTDG